jgi:hypothetical protein
MRRKIVFGLLLVMLGGLVALLALRQPTPHEAPVVEVPRDDADDAGTSAEGPADAGGAATAASDAGGADGDPARPVRVVGMGWDVIAPGVLGNDGTDPGDESTFSRHGVQTHFGAVGGIADVERALAAGGEQDDGADIAIVPLPEVVAAWERLRALSPHVFFVVAWSRGRDGVYGLPGAGLVDAPTNADVKLVGRAGEPATFLALFSLSLSGVDLERVRIVDPADAAVATMKYAAVDRGASDADRRTAGRRVLVTTADASRLIPWVAIAPEGFLRAHADAVTSWTRGWLEGVVALREDVPTAARSVAGTPGAPEAVALLRRLGQLDFIGLRDNARVAGLSGRGAVTIDALFDRTWDTWREVGVLSTPAPDAVPAYTGTVVSLVRADLELARPPAAEARAIDHDADVLLRHALPAGRVDDAQLVSRIGLLGGVFERSALKVAVRGPRNGHQAAITRACERYDLSRTRFDRAARVPGRASAVIEVLAAP